jgi:plastocyanin
MWVADPGTNSIVSLAMDGTPTAYPVPTPNAGLLGIATGPQGQVWFSESGANRIGRLANTQPHTQYVTIGAAVIEPNPPRLQLGSTAQWTFFGPGLQSVTDATGMGLYDSGPLPFVSFFSHTFTAAGDYTFHSTTSSLGGVIKVLPQLSAQTVAAGSPVTVTWATGPAPAGFHYEVQVRRPGHGNFTPWQTNATGPSAAYTTTAAGTYVFEARLVDTATSPQTSSDWSPPMSVAAS